MAEAAMQPSVLRLEIEDGINKDEALKLFDKVLGDKGYRLVCLNTDSFQIKRETPEEREERELREFVQKAYSMLDSGKTLKSVQEELGVTYRMLRHRHLRFQETVPEDQKRDLVQNRSGRGRKTVFFVDMEKVYHELDDEKLSIPEICRKLGIGERTLYAKHYEYQDTLPEGSPKRRKTLKKK